MRNITTVSGEEEKKVDLAIPTIPGRMKKGSDAYGTSGYTWAEAATKGRV